jgi:hypothetical protein
MSFRANRIMGSRYENPLGEAAAGSLTSVKGAILQFRRN